MCREAGTVVEDPMEEAVATGGGSGGRRVGSLSRADLDRWFAERRSAMDYAIERQAGGGSDGRTAGWENDSLMDQTMLQRARFVSGPGALIWLGDDGGAGVLIGQRRLAGGDGLNSGEGDGWCVGHRWRLSH